MPASKDIIHVEGNSSEADSTFLYVGEQQVYADTGSSFSYDIVVENTGKTWVKAIAVNSMESVADSFYYFVRPPLVIEDPPEGINNLEPGREYIYQYFIDGDIRVGDIYADKVSDPWNDKWITAATYPNMLTYPEGKTTGDSHGFSNSTNRIFMGN